MDRCCICGRSSSITFVIDGKRYNICRSLINKMLTRVSKEIKSDNIVIDEILSCLSSYKYLYKNEKNKMK